MHSKSPHYNPCDPKAHEPDLFSRGDRDEVGLVCSICVKVYTTVRRICLYKLNKSQERSSVKRKELYKTVQVKAGVLPPIQLLIDMKVRWSSTYVMVNRAEGSRKVNPL
jgi:hypothetical protein